MIGGPSEKPLPAVRAWTKKNAPAGRVAEWLKAPDSKSGVGVTLPWVQIPPLPPILHSFWHIKTLGD
jgi:hypothetical protein